MKYPIYLDYAATTPCATNVFDVMAPYFYQKFGNPNSLHFYGNEAIEGLDEARRQVVDLINADFDEIIFTSGSTEASNISIIRTILSIKKDFITTKTEHKSILDIANHLKMNGTKIVLLDIQKDGLLDLNYLEQNLNENSGLVSICLVNNETGVLQDIKKITEICHKNGTLVHIDATQGFGKIPIDVKNIPVDFMSVSGHKIYGPKGIGALYCKKSNMKYLRVPRANHEVEFGIRAGTVPVALCVGMGYAAYLAKNDMEQNLKHISELREMFIKGIMSQLDEIYINGSTEKNYPGIINMSFRGCEGEALMMEAKRIAVASGSACTSNKLSISHVLDAMKIPADIAQSSLRISIGKDTTKSNIEIAIEDLVNATKKLRDISPVWDMIKSGVDIDSIFNGRH